MHIGHRTKIGLMSLLLGLKNKDTKINLFKNLANIKLNTRKKF